MLFHTFPFLVFFTLVFAGYWAWPGSRGRLVWLVAASLYFYMSWNPWLISLILFSAGLDYLVALRLTVVRHAGLRLAMVAGSISVNLGLLAYYKYVNFFLDNINQLRLWLGLSPWEHVGVILPLGISFYTFETISYIVDVYRGRWPVVRNPLHYALYILFFPHLVAGPIVRPHEFLPQITRRKRWHPARLQVAAQLFLLGLFKKAVVADQLASLVDPVFAQPETYATAAVWLAVVGYAVQIYCDFSGYTEMARGLAHAFGYHLPHNFYWPYASASITEFWQRWHVSLSSWLRDYLYIPLGGNRHGALLMYRNLFVTMLLGGLWHGAQWTFIIWGGYHGLLLILNRVTPWPTWLHHRLGAALATVTTFLAVCVGWVFFRAASLADALAILQRVVLPAEGKTFDHPQTVVAWLVIAVMLAGQLAGKRWGEVTWFRRLSPWQWGLLMAAGFILTLGLMPDDHKAFIYFQF
jgi:alginate O-acetyltransferase complex protein AlgI